MLPCNTGMHGKGAEMEGGYSALEYSTGINIISYTGDNLDLLPEGESYPHYEK